MANFPENPLENEVKKIIDLAELKHEIPTGLLAAIAKVESDFVPYALNVEGKSIDVESFEEAKGKIKKIVAAGITSFDVGVMQINYRWHHKEFTNASAMLEPQVNVEYAAKLLKSLYEQHGDWHKAVRYYHSSTPLHHKKYSRKIITAWIGG